MKRVSQALCPRCGFVWNTSTKLVIERQAFCPGGCGLPGIIRNNPPVGERKQT
jgi:hypothetical protein